MSSHLDILNRLVQSKVMAVVRLPEADRLLPVARALQAGGITAIEFTMAGAEVLSAIEQARAHFGPQVLVGVGTVLDPETARSAILAGAEFVVTPTLKPATIEMCKRYGKPVIPGALTPTEILTAWEAGADMIKVFPASVMGPGYIKAVLAPLPQLRLMPTGGISADNAAAYLQAGAMALGGGGQLVDKAAVAQGNWAALTAEARRLMSAVGMASSTGG